MLKGKVLTVLGPREPVELGVVLPHEQPLLDLTALYREPRSPYKELIGDISQLDFQFKNLGKIRQYPYSVKANLIVDNVEEVISELTLLKTAGGGTLCDVSPVNVRLKRDSLPTISRQTGLHIVAGTSYYVEPVMTDDVRGMSKGQMCDFLVGEVQNGIGDTGVRCGLIGEVGCSYPITDNERRSLEASVMAQQITGSPLMIHTGAHKQSPFEIVDILETAGADMSHTALGHLDRTLFEDEDILRLAEKGCYLEYDLFGTECSHFQLSRDIDFPNDRQNVRRVKLLVDNGFTDQILISQDVHTKHRMACYGGHGYTYILENVVPMLKEKGITKDIITQIITRNPQTWLTFTK